MSQERTDPLALDSQDAHDRIRKVFRYAQVGRCVSSVTHDVNNHLGAMLAYAELVGLDDSLSAESRRMIGELTSAVKKCSELITAFTGIAREDRPNQSVVSLDLLVNRVLELRSHGMRVGQVMVQTDYVQAIPALLADEPKLTLAVLYLICNAEEAVRGTEGAVVRVQIRCEDDESIELGVWDTGEPVPEALRDRIFEPFFTTKEGDHLGLGLSATREIARMHKGDVTYDPAKGFVMRLPLSNGFQIG